MAREPLPQALPDVVMPARPARVLVLLAAWVDPLQGPARDRGETAMTVRKKGAATGAKAAAARSRLSSERKAVVVSYAKMAKRLAQADGLWRHWCSTDITEDEDEWIAFSNAVRAHLDGKPVPKRFVKP